MSNVNYVLASIYTDILFFGLCLFFAGEHIKFRISSNPLLNVTFAIGTFCYAVNLYRFVYVWRNVKIHGLFDKTAVVLRVFLIAVLLFLLINAREFFVEPDDKESSVIVQRALLALLPLSYFWFTYKYKEIIWGTRSQHRSLIKAYKKAEVAEQSTQVYPKTWGKVRVLEDQGKIEGGDSFVKTFERNTRGTGKMGEPARQSRIQKPVEQPRPQGTQKPSYQAQQPQVYVPPPPPKPKPAPRQEPVPQSRQSYGKVRVLEENDDLEMNDSWIKRYERQVLNQNKRNSKPVSTLPPVQRQSQVSAYTNPDTRLSDITEQNNDDSRQTVRTEPGPSQKQPQPLQQEPPKPQFFGKIRANEQVETVAETDSWVKRYEREVLGVNRPKTQTVIQKPQSQELKEGESRQTFQESRPQQPVPEHQPPAIEYEAKKRELEAKPGPANETPVQKKARIESELSRIYGKVRVLERVDYVDTQNSFVKAFEKEQRRKERETAKLFRRP